uniref:Putative secreted protein n=1 Tax=Anopheles darlingi TaxID=43151 RepID=A0A2M4DD56_ANODA
MTQITFLLLSQKLFPSVLTFPDVPLTHQTVANRRCAADEKFLPSGEIPERASFPSPELPLFIAHYVRHDNHDTVGKDTYEICESKIKYLHITNTGLGPCICCRP